MVLADFQFDLPASQIAQAPLPDRDASRLLVLSSGGEDGVRHLRFRALPSLLRAGDVLVMNDTRVFAARLVGWKSGTGGRAELLLADPAGERGAAAALTAAADGQEWLCLGQASKGLRVGARLEFAGGLSASVLEALGGGDYRVRLSDEAPRRPLAEALAAHGRLPLPPYIEREAGAADVERYQTVFAARGGSVAAPTAGLHFTVPLLSELDRAGIERCSLTLDVGPGTFLPVRDEDLDRHRMHAERFEIPESTAERVAKARREGRRVVAVGTTVVRALEAAYDPAVAGPRPGVGRTALFVRPGFTFRVVDALITNFHLPASTLLMLVCALGGTRRVMAAYREAVASGYRFYSYGDAMLLDRVNP